MERHTQALDAMSALYAPGDDDTVEVRILRPHETYRKSLAACPPDTADWTVTKVDEP
jgi:hypothetical protein